MPHDADGNLLKVGDHVMIPGVITAIYGDEKNTSCNCDIELEHPMPAYPETKQHYSAINTRQVEKCFGYDEPLSSTTEIGGGMVAAEMTRERS